MNLSAYQRGLLKGSLVASFLYITCISAGLYCLHCKHETELDALEKDTAMACIDFVTQHYERVIRRREKESQKAKPASIIVPDVNSVEFQNEIDAMNNYEDSDD